MFVIQSKESRHHDWHVIELFEYPRRFKTLADAQAAFKTLSSPETCRIAEEYTVTRYKAIKGARRARN